ncbi:hypothetical protein JW835_04725 [bacterium]|nr:hypothetical protein [bacterium]RQV97213.1 MAG: hypothetical protein EH221_04040 [bacterium]
MQFQDQSLGFEISLPDGWRKLFIFEKVNGNLFKDCLPPVLTDGPVLVGPAGDSMVVTIQQTKQKSVEDIQKDIQKIAKEYGLVIEKTSSIRIQSESHVTVNWRKPSQKKLLKTYFIIFSPLLWSLTLVLNEHEGYYDQIIETFNVLPLVRKMMK